MNRQALEFGADACLVVTPYYVKPTQQGMIEVCVPLRLCLALKGAGGG
jgi:dihydrodipicolinate synthase/N-acetylneuraminate lyase